MVLRQFWDDLKMFSGCFEAILNGFGCSGMDLGLFWDGFVAVWGWFCNVFVVLLRPGCHTFGRGATLFSYKHEP